MRQEIDEIPEAVSRFLDGSAAALAEGGKALRAADPAMIVTIARGSSDHAAAFLKYAIELTAGIPVASVGPSIVSIYGRELKLRGCACHRHLAVGQEPRHRGAWRDRPAATAR